MIKFKQILKEDTITSPMVKVLNVMVKLNLDPLDISENINTLKTKFAITDDFTAATIAIVYKKYYDELGADKNFKSLMGIDIGYNIDDYDDDIIALYQLLGNTHPELLVKTPYGEIEDILGSTEYWVMTESEADEAFKDRANDDINMHLDSGEDLGWLQSYVVLDDDSVAQFASEDAEYRVEEMDDNEIIFEYGAQDELELLETEFEEKEEKLNEVDNQISDLEVDRDYKQDEIDVINEEISDLTTEYELSTDQEEMKSLEHEIYDLNVEKHGLTKELSQYNERLEELQIEFDELEEIVDEGIDSAKSQLADKYRDDVIEIIRESIIDEVEHEGLDYFINNLGYSVKDATEHFGILDRDDIINDMEQDRGNVMSGYDGIEHEEQVNGETYYIYRMN